MTEINTNANTDSRPAIFLDRDGTLIEDVGYISKIDQIIWFDDTVAALKRLAERFRLFVVSNQSGIATGELTPKQVETVNAHIDAELGRNGIAIERWYVCPHSRGDRCRCMKPAPFFLEEAARDFGIPLEKSFAVGDHPHDLTFIERKGGIGLYLLTGHGERHRKELPEGTPVYPNLLAAVEVIMRT